MTLEIKDLAGASQPLVKLIEVVSTAIGTLYEPRKVRLLADARAYEMKAIARAEVESEVATKAIQFQALSGKLSSLAPVDTELAHRARLRLLAREIEGQLNVEQIADQATLSLPSVVSAELVSADWRRKFFQHAENVCELDMQMLWGKVLAGEIAQPGSFGLRTLETLKQLSSSEAEQFRLLCGIAMAEGWVALPGFDINTALVPFGFAFNAVLNLRDAGLVLHGDKLHINFNALVKPNQSEIPKVVLVNNGVMIQISGTALGGHQFPALIFTQAGKELQRLIVPTINEQYLTALGTAIRQRNLVGKRGTLIPQDETNSLIVFEQDL